MSMTPGSRIGPYEVMSAIGQGGMGVVYRARDTQLQRDVALKLLPEHFANDAERLSRFEREAQVLASLNHPNIAQIYGLEKSGSGNCIVMELVEGETLAVPLERGPFPLDEAVNIASQIVDALEAAHERGIVHRDLKPGNIKRTLRGAIKVLDFGLAKVAAPAAGGNPNLSNSPTLASGSLEGVILGTAPYMSPEQARGKTVDARTDIWAFGCVLFEMLTGRQAFAGETTTDVLAKVLEGQPQWSAIPADTPRSIRMLLQSALNKDPKRRLQHIGDARVFLDRPAMLDTSTPTVIRDKPGRRAWFAAAALAVAFIAALVPAVLYFMRPPTELPVMRFEMPAPGIVNGTLAISPDGQRIAYLAAAKEGKPAIWIRSLGSLTAQPLAGTENATAPFWAPDSQRLAFYADGKLKKTDVSGGGVQVLADAVITAPGTWNRNGVILFAGFSNGPAILRTSDSGGEATPVTAADSSVFLSIWPEFLPDGRHFLFHTLNGNQGALWFGSLDSKSVTKVMGIANLGLRGDSPAVYRRGYLLFSADRTLLAQPFDPVHGTLSGERMVLAENVRAEFSVTETGVLVYRAGAGIVGQTAPSRLSWMDRKGNSIGEIATPAQAGNVRLFDDGRVVMDNAGGVGGVSPNADVWVLDGRGIPNKLTADNPYPDFYPIWSPDGTHIVFGSARDQKIAPHLYQKLANGVGSAEPLLAENGDNIEIPLDWSAAGILFNRFTAPTALTNRDIWFLSMPDKKPSRYLHNGFSNGQAQFSPDGRYVAYTTNESGSFQIVVQTFPDPAGGKWIITAQGGSEPIWKRDGRELYYLAADGKIMSVSIKTAPKFEAGPPTALFQTSLTPQPNPFVRRYAVSADGQRFLFGAAPAAPAAGGDSVPITAVINWPAALRKK
jgi:Tol biopolymer transport system component